MGKRSDERKSDKESPPLFIPTEIPWQDIKGKDLEELLYWLFDAMGAKELEWRIGGSGSGAADNGRDLELSFYTSSPDGELCKQRWWVEAKGRSKTVRPHDVKCAVKNVPENNDIDVLVIATNSTFSNPTRDWIKNCQKSNIRFQIKLWEKTELENLCTKNPIAVVRLFSKALSPQGKLEVVNKRLWDYARYTEEPTLDLLWRNKTSITIDPQALVALVASEMANGNIAFRSWGIYTPIDTTIDALANGLVNFLYLIHRIAENGTRQEPLIQGLSYLFLICIDKIGPEETTKLISKVFSSDEGSHYDEEIQKFILKPIFGTLFDEMHDICTEDCLRMSSEKTALTRAEDLENYWNRLSITERDFIKNDTILTIESHNEPCQIGLRLDENDHCPLRYNRHNDYTNSILFKLCKLIIENKKNIKKSSLYRLKKMEHNL